jgi:hypothetical protein
MMVGLVEYLGASWFLYLLVLLASWNFCLNSTPAMGHGKNPKGQIMIYKALHRRLEIEQSKPL